MNDSKNDPGQGAGRILLRFLGFLMLIAFVAICLCLHVKRLKQLWEDPKVV